MKKTVWFVAALTQLALAQEGPWKTALERIEGIQSYRLQVRATNQHELPKSGTGARVSLVQDVTYLGPARLRIEETGYSDGAFQKRSSRALTTYDGQTRYFEFHSPERDQKIRNSMKGWIEAGQPFQGDYPNWGTCFVEKRDYLGSLRELAGWTGWTQGADQLLSGKNCQTWDCDHKDGDSVIHYRAYLDAEGWLRGLDTWYPDAAGKAVYVWRMRYLNIQVNPPVDPSLFQVKNPKSYTSWD